MKKALFAFSSSKKGVDYFKMINNAWAVVRKELEPKAIIPLREGKLLNGDQEYFLDEDGEPIPGKVKIID